MNMLICSAWRKELIWGIYKTKTQGFLITLKRQGMRNKDGTRSKATCWGKVTFVHWAMYANYSLAQSLLCFFLINVYNYGLTYCVQTSNSVPLLLRVWQGSDFWAWEDYGWPYWAERMQRGGWNAVVINYGLVIWQLCCCKVLRQWLNSRKLKEARHLGWCNSDEGENLITTYSHCSPFSRPLPELI